MNKSSEPAASPLRSPRRTVGFFTACGIVIANIIGTGVFTSLGFQVADIHSGFALLMLWIVGGIAALCGALCYGELSAALPRSGGEYHFLSEIYHPALGFMAGFISATVGFAAPIALAARAFGNYFHGVFNFGSPIEEKQQITFLPHAADTMAIFSGAFAVALVYVMYSYSGWNASSYIIGEVKNQER